MNSNVGYALVIGSVYLLINLIIFLWYYWPPRAFVRLKATDSNRIPLVVIEHTGDSNKATTVAYVPFVIVPPLSVASTHNGSPRFVVIAEDKKLPLGGESPENIVFGKVGVHYAVVKPKKERYTAPGGSARLAFESLGPGVLLSTLSQFSLDDFMTKGGYDKVSKKLHEEFALLSADWGVSLVGDRAVSMTDYDLPGYIEKGTEVKHLSAIEIETQLAQANAYGMENHLRMSRIEALVEVAKQGNTIVFDSNTGDTDRSRKEILTLPVGGKHVKR